MNVHSRRLRAVIIISLVAAMVLTAAGCQVAASFDITGPWHNEQLNEVVRFHDDGTVVVRTAEGDFEAKYVYDSKSAQGVITLNGAAINFTPAGDSIMLTMGDTQSEFKRGDMEVVIATATVAPTEAPTESPTEAPTEEPTQAPTEAPTQEPTDSPEPTFDLGPFPDVSFHPLPSNKPSLSAIPKISGLKPGDVFGGLTSITGDWYLEDNNDYVLTLDENGGYTLQTGGFGFGGTYTYDKATKKGVITIMYDDMDFTVSGDTMTWKDGTTFKR